ncbi:MAG: hypothetical protein Q7R96_03445 [Nanoarchaeota archaeon]|nr:hypothetical protein [Nanoarchaeota archaeon]
MLEEKLIPIRTQLRPKKKKTNYKKVLDWFSEHQENLVEEFSELPFLCTLPHYERILLTYPVLGNFFLHQFRTFIPQTPYQQKACASLEQLAQEKRFNNPHMEQFYQKKETFNELFDACNGYLLTSPKELAPITRFLEQLAESYGKEIDKLFSIIPEKPYTCDLGHGLIAPYEDFTSLTWYAEVIQKNSQPTNLTIMVVDDEHPEIWYNRLLAAGFKKRENQQGYFHDCETALEALRTGHYDVILSDLDLGKGHMPGIQFVEEAYALQKTRGIPPCISVFSYDNKALQKAEEKLFTYKKGEFTGKVFHQVAIFDQNNKRNFRATHFLLEVQQHMMGSHETTP